MTDEASSRPRTATRLKGEAPPGLAFGAEEGRPQIGRYEIIKTIGKGAMGVVYKARDPLLDRVVAVKTIMSPQGQGRRVRSAFLERFQREAKAAAKMQHPAIVTIFDVGVDEESGAPFMVLEYLPGESLADRLDRVRFPLGKAVQIGLDLSSALSFAHRQRIVHRDVKPANVLHAGENRWKLADFGIARLPDSDLTQVGIFMGTPGYSPPEAIREGRYTPQADVFAWGAVMYELMSGRIPYEGPDTKTTNSYVVSGNALPPTRHDSSIPEPLSIVMMTALEPSDKTRFRDASEAEQALREAWDRCLTQGLVHPAVLAMDEMAHDKVGARMHEPRIAGPRPSAPVTLSAGDSTELTAISGPPRKNAHAHNIEARSPVRDDDPTKLIVRDDKRKSSDGDDARPDQTSRGIGKVGGKLAAEAGEPGDNDATKSNKLAKPVAKKPTADKMKAQAKPVAKPAPADSEAESDANAETAGDAEADAAEADAAAAKPAKAKAVAAAPVAAPRRSPVVLIILLVLLVGVGTVAALHFAHVITIPGVPLR